MIKKLYLTDEHKTIFMLNKEIYDSSVIQIYIPISRKVFSVHRVIIHSLEEIL